MKPEGIQAVVILDGEIAECCCANDLLVRGVRPAAISNLVSNALIVKEACS
jgi:hydrogenase maturation factor